MLILHQEIFVVFYCSYSLCRRQHSRNNVPQSPVPRAYAIQQNSEVVDEMLANESNYIEELTVGIQAYMTSDDQTDILELYDIFRNIQQIKDFHKNSFYNFLTNCGKDVTNTSIVFSKCIQVWFCCCLLFFK